MAKSYGKLFLIYGVNGAGKSTLARFLATKYRGLHIELDWFSSMHRGKPWHTRKNNVDKINLLLGTLSVALKKTNYKLFFVDGVLIYHFMFKMIEEWCSENGIKFYPIKLIGDVKDFDLRVVHGKTVKKNWNKELPRIYKKLTYQESEIFDVSGTSVSRIAAAISKYSDLTKTHE